MTVRYRYRFAIGVAVKTVATVRPAQYANRRGVVVRHFEGELGVQLDRSHAHQTTWFVPAELVPACP